MNLVLTCDHGGYKLKEEIKKLLTGWGIEFADYGVFTEDSVDYPKLAFTACQAIVSGQFARGILICGTGIGMSIAANRVRGIRAALCADVFSARMSREHNDANVLCLGGRVLDTESAGEIVKTWLHTQPADGRHNRRRAMIDEYVDKD